MRAALLLVLSACGRLGFADEDGAPGDGAPLEDALRGDGSPGDGRTDPDAIGGEPVFALVDCASVVLVGDSVCVNSAVRLTRDDGATRTAGGAYLPQPITLGGAGVRIHMTLRVTTIDGAADGLSFVVHDDVRGTGALGPGNELGYGGITPSIGLELDTYDDGGTESTDNHYGYNENGSTASGISGTLSFDINSGAAFHAWLDVSPSRVAFWASPTAMMPSSASIQLGVTGLPWLNGPVHVGIVAGSEAGFSQNHEVLAWTVTAL